MQYSTKYIFLFAAAICLVCSTMVSVSAVVLRERQEANKVLDRQKSVLQAARIIKPGDKLSAEQVREKFASIRPALIDLASGEYVEGVDPALYDFDEAAKMPIASNPAQIQEVPEQVQVFQVMNGEKVEALILPIYGKGLWSTLYGYLALEADASTVRGITYYQHGETPGLGGEVDNPKWKALWPGRKIFGPEGDVKIAVVKGQAGPISEDPHHVDGLSGATITSRGVSNMLKFWMSERGLGPYLAKFRANGSV